MQGAHQFFSLVSPRGFKFLSFGGVKCYFKCQSCPLKCCHFCLGETAQFTQTRLVFSHVALIDYCSS